MSVERTNSDDSSKRMNSMIIYPISTGVRRIKRLCWVCAEPPGLSAWRWLEPFPP